MTKEVFPPPPVLYLSAPRLLSALRWLSSFLPEYRSPVPTFSHNPQSTQPVLMLAAAISCNLGYGLSLPSPPFFSVYCAVIYDHDRGSPLTLVLLVGTDR